MPPQFSIIIPVYNDEKNIVRCFESVLSQTYNDFECLLINDGSTDKTPIICDNYSKNDPRFYTFHKKNEGTSKTRQFGINNSKGKYTIFIDSDDWVEPVFLENIVRKIENNKTGIIFMDFIEENSSGHEKYIHQGSPFVNSEAAIKLVFEGKLFSCLWNIIINRDLYLSNNTGFAEGINYGEDSLFIIELLLNNPEIDYLTGAYYHHTYNHGSFTRKSKKTRYIERIKFLRQIPLILEKYNRNDLAEYNFFPFNDKYEMLCSGEFSKSEYHSLIPLSFTQYYKKNTKNLKYALLVLAESKFYFLAKKLAFLIRILKNK